MADKDRITSTLYHLGKGIWKSLPVVGPVIEEVFYEQFRDELLNTVDKLTPEQLEALQESLPDREQVKKLEEKLTNLSDEQRAIAAKQLLQVLDRFDSAEQSLEEIQGGVTQLSAIVGEIAKDLLNADELNELIRRIRAKRAEWRNRISANQQLLLGAIPDSYLQLCQLWEITQSVIPDCSYKEFRFRLHELEWLELVERRRISDTWEYRRSDYISE